MPIIQANPGFSLAVAINADHSDVWRVDVCPIVAWDIDAGDSTKPCPIAIDAQFKDYITTAIVHPNGAVGDCANIEEWLACVKRVAATGTGIPDPFRAGCDI